MTEDNDQLARDDNNDDEDNNNDDYGNFKAPMISSTASIQTPIIVAGV